MANNHSTLTGLFTDIADAIRVKTGGTESIVADNFPTAIGEIVPQEDLDSELTTQNDLIAQIATALEGKTGASSEDLSAEMTAQEEAIASQNDLIAQIATALEGKTGASGGGAEIETCTVSFDGGRGSTTKTICTRLINGVITTTTESYTEMFTDIVRGTIFCAIDEGDDCIPTSVSGDAEIVYDLYSYDIKSGSIIAINGNCTIHLGGVDFGDPA